MPSSTVENYVKKIYMACQQSGDPLVPMGLLAQSMEVTPGTATSMVKTLSDAGLVDYRPRSGVLLTKNGETLALHVLRRHRLVELFLVDVLGLDWSEVHEEAEMLEHVISDRVLERMDHLLGRPTEDPHGDPIPSPAGQVPAQKLTPLDRVLVGEGVRIARVSDRDPAFLRFLEKSGLLPGTVVEIKSKNSAGESIVLGRTGKRNVTLGLAAAHKILTG